MRRYDVSTLDNGTQPTLRHSESTYLLEFSIGKADAFYRGMTKSYRFRGIRYGASISFAGRTIQISYRTPHELVRALQDMGRSATGGLVVLKLYTKGEPS